MTKDKKIAFRVHTERFEPMDIYDDGNLQANIKTMCDANGWDTAEVSQDVDLALRGEQTPIRWVDDGHGVQIVFA